MVNEQIEATSTQGLSYLRKTAPTRPAARYPQVDGAVLPGTVALANRPITVPAGRKTVPGGSTLSGWHLVDEDVTVAREKEVADFKGLIRIIVKGSKETNDGDPRA